MKEEMDEKDLKSLESEVSVERIRKIRALNGDLADVGIKPSVLKLFKAHIPEKMIDAYTCDARKGARFSSCRS